MVKMEQKEIQVKKAKKETQERRVTRAKKEIQALQVEMVRMVKMVSQSLQIQNVVQKMVKKAHILESMRSIQMVVAAQ